MKIHYKVLISVIIIAGQLVAKSQVLKPDTLSFKPFVWLSEAPKDCPFEQSKDLTHLFIR